MSTGFYIGKPHVERDLKRLRIYTRPVTHGHIPTKVKRGTPGLTKVTCYL